MEIRNDVVMTKRFLRKFINTLMAYANSMSEKDLIDITFFQNTILVDLGDTMTVIKLEKQD